MRLWAHLRYALRWLRANPGFAASAGLTMALGIGANTAVFSLVDAVLLRPLPYSKPQELVSIQIDLRGRNQNNVGMSVAEMDDLRERSGVFAGISAVRRINANLTGSDRPERIEALGVSPEYFAMLGASAQLGRVFGDEDRVAGFAEAVILSDGLWRRLFGGDRSILGRKLRLDDDLYAVAGVMPPGFRHPSPTTAAPVEMWLTTGFSGMPWPRPNRRAHMIPAAVGRLKSGLTISQAQAGLESFTAALSRQYPDFYPPGSRWTVRLTPLKQEVTENLRATLLVVFGAVTFVLLICCVSIANLVVAKAMGRQREIAVRRALGAPWRTLIAQLLAESITISLMGGAAAWLAVGWSEPWLARLVPAALPVFGIGVSGTVLGFTFCISVLTGIVFGLAPVFPLMRTDVARSLKDGSRGATGSSAHQRFRSALVVCEIAFSLMLMVGCGLLLHSFWKVSRLNPGFNPKNVLLANLRLPYPNDASKGKYTRPAPQVVFMRDVLRHVRELPGVEWAAIGAGASTPLSGFNVERFRPEGYTGPQGEGLSAEVTAVTPDFFRVLGTPLVRGRMLTETDERKQPDVVLVDERMARLAWPNQDPIGKRFADGPDNWVTVVGVVGDLKSRALEEPDMPHVYASAYQQSELAMTIFVRTAGNPAALGDSLRRAVHQVDPDQPIYAVRTLEEVVARSLAQRRFQLQAIGAFALVALLLAAIGIYGVTAFWVRQRAHEIGIRMALGAQSGDVVRLVLRQGLKVTLCGLAAGLAGAIPLALMVRTLLFSTEPFDPLTFLAMPALLGATALAACYLPARAAVRVEPARALRAE